MTQSPCLVLVLDFDGTITQSDVGDALCDRFAPAQWKDIDAEWIAGRLPLAEAQRKMWALVEAERSAFLAAAQQVGAFRAGFTELLEHSRAHNWRLVLASGGFDVYIEALLGPWASYFHEQYCNSATLEGGGVAVSFPWRQSLGCARCAVCKGAVVRQVRIPGVPIIFAGDGHSDFCAAGQVDRLFAVRGRSLHIQCERLGQPVEPFEDFRQLLKAIAG